MIVRVNDRPEIPIIRTRSIRVMSPTLVQSVWRERTRRPSSTKFYMYSKCVTTNDSSGEQFLYWAVRLLLDQVFVSCVTTHSSLVICSNNCVDIYLTLYSKHYSRSKHTGNALFFPFPLWRVLSRPCEEYIRGNGASCHCSQDGRLCGYGAHASW